VCGFYQMIIFLFFLTLFFSFSLTGLAHLAVPKRSTFLENLPAVQPRARILLHSPNVGRK
jgi:hypothetical protein